MQHLDDAGSIDLGGLLTIDVASELRKLSQAQFQGPWQLPAELVRRALRGGATDVRVTTARHSVHISDDGGGYPPEHLQWATSLLDDRRPNEERHAALTALESSGELVLLALAGLEIQQLRIETVHDGTRTMLEVAPGRAPWLEYQDGVAGRWTDIRLRCGSLDRRQVSQWLHTAARFVSANVVLDGTSVASGFANPLVEGALQAPLRGRLAVVKEGDSAHVWLLEHGLVTGHVTVPEAPNLEAAVELGSEATDLSAARLREAIAPHIPKLVEQGVALLVHLGVRGPLAEPQRTRVARLVLQAARKKLRVEQIRRVPVFRVVDSSGQRCVDLETLAQAAQRGPSGDNVLSALYPTQKPERFTLGKLPVLIADASERSRLAELLRVRFRPPDPRDTSGSLRLAWRRGLDGASLSLRRLGTWLRHPVRAPPLDDAALAPDERSFVDQLRSHLLHDPRLEVQGVRMCGGAGPIRRSGGARIELILPRQNPTVIAAITAVNHDPSWVYPVVLTLLEGRGLPPATTRAHWLRRLAAGRR